MATGVPFSNTPIFSKVPPFLRSAPFGEVRLSRLHALLDSLGGILWMPNQHNYVLTADTAVAESGDPVGYMGSHRQNLPENYVKNSMMVGAGAGTWPTGWVASTSGNDISIAITGSGTDSDGAYVEVSLSGVAGGTGSFPSISINGAANSGNHPAASYAQMWTGQFKAKGVSGTQRAVRMRLARLTAADAATGTAAILSQIPINDSVTNYTLTHVIAETDAAKMRLYLDFSIAAGSGTWDNVFRIYAPQLERGKPTAFTPTYGEAITRGANFEPAWQDTTANKPLLGVDADGKGILTYDGSNDFFRTGIQTPEAGYIAGVWASNSSGVAGGIFASSNINTIPGVYFNKGVSNNLVIRKTDGSAETLSSTGTGLMTGGAKRVVDAHFDAAGVSIRVDGTGAQASGVVVPTSTNYFRIGAAGAGGDNQANYWLGTMLAQIWIPGARPGATVEAEIRRLLAEITAVSGVV